MRGVEFEGSAAKLRLYDQVLSCLTFDQTPDDFLGPMARTLGAASGVLFHIAPAPDHVGIRGAAHHGVADDSVHAYLEQHHRQDPILKQTIACLRGAYAPRRLQIDLVSGGVRWRDSEFYSDFLRSAGICHGLAARLLIDAPEGRQAFLMAFHRPEHAPSFGLKEARFLQSIAGLMNAVLFGVAARTAHGTVPQQTVAAGAAQATQISSDGQGAAALTERESEVLQALLLGCTNANIAARLAISVRTAENHVRSILAKFQVSSRAQLIATLYKGHANPPV